MARTYSDNAMQREHYLKTKLLEERKATSQSLSIRGKKCVQQSVPGKSHTILNINYYLQTTLFLHLCYTN